MRKDEFPLIEAYADSKVNEVLAKIRAEIETKYGQCSICEYDSDYGGRWYYVGDIADILQMIDNCKAETEETDGTNKST